LVRISIRNPMGESARSNRRLGAAVRMWVKVISLFCALTQPWAPAWAQPQTKPPTFISSVGLKFIQIPAGEFDMGPSGSADPGYIKLVGPVHHVTLSAFWMNSNMVTNTQFEKFRKRHKRSEDSRGDDMPVGDVTHQDALDFAAWLSKQDGVAYTLPTEAQWEYAARGGLQGMDYPWGNEDPDGRCWFGAVTCKPVGSYPPNGYGLYDMAGNAWEYVIEADYEYSAKDKHDPVGPLKGDSYVTRGGGLEFELKVFERSTSFESILIPEQSFRLVCNRK